jgi:8-oxo-dGTP pyrophosphatase MutT (NUDIX family)
MLKYPAQDSVTAVTSCDLRVDDGTWGYTHVHANAIEAAWQSVRIENPAFFNGTIHLINGLRLEDGCLHATFLRTNFKTYLHWRRAGFPETGILDGFGSALIKSADGAVLLGRQRAGNINAGLAYLPGGFIDARDAGPDGRIDITASVVRELQEETGLSGADLQPQPGFLITQTAAHVSIAATFQVNLDAESMKSKIEKHIAADPESELTDIVIVRQLADLEGLAMPHYARVLLQQLLSPVGQVAKT